MRIRIHYATRKSHRRQDVMKEPTKLGNRSFYFEKIQCKQPVIKHWSWKSRVMLFNTTFNNILVITW